MMTNQMILFNQLDHAVQQEMLQRMYQIRFFEEAAGLLYKKGRLKGGIHASIGQEAVAVGICAQLTQQDYIASTHRGHGHHIAKGADLGKLMAEILGKATGYCGGKGGSMHVAAFEVGSLGAFPVVAAGVPSAVGAALSGRLRGQDYVTVAFFGDGALGQGILYEAFNLAAIWKLPVLFVCENNQYAVSSSVDQTIAIRDIPGMAEKHGLAVEETDGQDLLAVYQAAQRAILRARQGGGPTFLHARTYRFEGHYFGEPQVYRSREEVAQARRNRDPIHKYCEYLLQNGVADQARIEGIEESARKSIEQALRYAEESPEPAPEEYGDDVYA
jgi:TPP-dependent pyruvate/acetoin dehydrogenase alpha subunit